MAVKGFVKQFSVKSGTSKRGPWSLYTTRLDLGEGQEFDGWLSFGFDDPKLKDGDYIQVEYEEVNGRFTVTKLDRLKNPPAREAEAKPIVDTKVPKGTTATPTTSSEFNKKTNPEDAARMTYAAARTAALEVVGLLLEYDGLPVSAAKTKAGQAKRFNEVTAFVDKLTVQYFNDGLSLRLLEKVADAGLIDSKPSSDLPDDADEDDSQNDDGPDPLDD